MIKIFILFLVIYPLHILCQSKPPNADIWLFQIDNTGETIRLRQPKKIAGKDGYENQPCFTKDGKEIYFTAQYDTSSPTAIYAYNLSSGQTKQITFTKTSVYSPTPLNAGNGISVLMVEENGAQRIYQYPFSNAKPFALFAKRDSIGYYAWIDAHSVLAFILPGKNNPTRLSVIKDDGKEIKVAENVERGMKIIGKGALYVQVKDSANYLYWSDFTTTRQLSRTPGMSMDLAIYKNYILMADKGIMYAAEMKKKNMQLISLGEFKKLQDLSSYGLKNISRIAVSPDEKFIAVVITE